MPEHQSVSAYPTVSVIVLNYNSLAHLKANLDSLMALDYPQGRLEIVLADNASTDASLEWVARHYPEVRILQHGTNLGFAEGNTRVGADGPERVGRLPQSRHTCTAELVTGDDACGQVG